MYHETKLSLTAPPLRNSCVQTETQFLPVVVHVNVLIIALHSCNATLAVSISIARFKKEKRNWKCKLDRESSPFGCLTFHVCAKDFKHSAERLEGKGGGRRSGKGKYFWYFHETSIMKSYKRPEIEYFLCITGFKRSNVLPT